MTLPLDTLTPGLVAGLMAVFLGALVQGSVGFGLALFSAPVLVLVRPELVPGPLLAAALVLTILVALRDRRSMEVSDLGWILGGRLAGCLMGAILLGHLDDRTFKIFFGLSILGAVVSSLAGLALSRSRPNMVAVGVVSGVMAVTTSVGGPPVALLYQDAEGGRLRGTLGGFFTLGVVFSLGSLALVGRFGLHEVVLSLPLMAAVVLGFGFSGLTHARLDRRRTRQAVLLLSTISSMAILVQAT